MSSLLYQLSYSLYNVYKIHIKIYYKRICSILWLQREIYVIIHQNIKKNLCKGLILTLEGLEPSSMTVKVSSLNPSTIRPLLFAYLCNLSKPSASIALASAGYKTATLLLC